MKHLLTIIAIVFSIEGMGQTKDSIFIISVMSDSVISMPCKIDTIRGRIFYHTNTDYDYGNTWDFGYWIGKCGPAGSMPVDSLIFIPGVCKVSSHEFLDSKCKTFKKGIEYYYNEGFRDSRFRKIPARNVYCMIILR